MITTYLHFFTRSTEPSQPSAFFKLLRQYLPKAWPKKFYMYENEPIPFTEDNLNRFIQCWWDSMFWWKRKRPKVSGHVFLGTAHEHTGVLHLFETRLADDDACRQFLIEVSRQFHADYAFAHALDEPSSWSSEETQINGSVPLRLQDSLPGIPWAACYGKPYVDMFGKQELLSVPVHDCREVGPELVLCQLTSRLLDAVENPSLIQERREAVYQRLGRDAFCDPQNPDWQGRVPAFQKPIVVRPQATR